MKIIDLGWCVARLNTLTKMDQERLIITSPSSSDEGLYQPSESVTIWGRDAMLTLRDALNEAYPPEMKEDG